VNDSVRGKGKKTRDSSRSLGGFHRWKEWTHREENKGEGGGRQETNNGEEREDVNAEISQARGKA